jgi:hypothetical protein
MTSGAEFSPYETMVMLEDKAHSVGLTFIALPANRMNAKRLTEPYGLLKELECESVQPIQPRELARELFEVLLFAERGERRGGPLAAGAKGSKFAEQPQQLQQPLPELAAQDGPARQVRELAEYLTFVDLIMFELSDPKEYSLASLTERSARRVIEISRTALGRLEHATFIAVALSPGAAALVPVAFKGLIAGVGVIVVVDTVGVVVAVARSGRVKKASENAVDSVRKTLRRWVKR